MDGTSLEGINVDKETKYRYIKVNAWINNVKKSGLAKGKVHFVVKFDREYCVLRTARGNTVYCLQREGIRKKERNVVREPQIDLLCTKCTVLSIYLFICSVVNDA